MTRYRLRTLLIVFALGSLVILWAFRVVPWYSVLPIVPPRSITATAIGETQVRIHMYMLAHRDYPADLSVLPRREGYANSVTDGWRKQLIYAVDPKGIISLTSLGRDGKPGGGGDDADVTLRYRTRKDDGSLNIDDPLWLAMSRVDD